MKKTINNGPKLNLVAKSENQKEYLRSIENNKITFVNGPAGSGKSYMATVYGLSLLLQSKIDKLFIGRPLVQSDIESGFLPGTLEEKLEPYLRPIMDIMGYSQSHGELQKLIKDKKIECAPIGYLRGRTFLNSFIIMDEMQNADYEQLILVLTRLGKNSKMVLTGDLTQSDLGEKRRGGLGIIMNKLENVPGIGVVNMGVEDIQREPIIKLILEKLNE